MLSLVESVVLKAFWNLVVKSLMLNAESVIVLVTIFVWVVVTNAVGVGVGAGVGPAAGQVHCAVVVVP